MHVHTRVCCYEYCSNELRPHHIASVASAVRMFGGGGETLAKRGWMAGGASAGCERRERGREGSLQAQSGT
eukprot:1158189-Rhodomonas_salina.1